ncbi:MarR family transcriptional regulator [Mycobacterium sp. E136]|uniref:MarR family winged helix-turn-helix transcriptional regulator n=1 Tax=Mycobacterium sp. E136 TaxID=1834125 RepID=UPI0007FDE084|nr:MarR family winged helix-turn-helix transcriptional regulator [Mycobacterium sp. E136]OBG95071.1 MarR family transcriptional regulator [Mycobacterium sp. E136]
MRGESQVRRFQADSLQRHAIEFGEWMVRASNERARTLGHAKLRPAHARLMVFIDWEGSRISDIAKAQDVSKNAVGQLVTELEEIGYLERVPDPADGRAKVVRYTEAGHALLADAATIAEQLNAEIGAIIGEKRLAELRSTLADICHHLGLGPQPT